MKLIKAVIRSALSRHFQNPRTIRAFSASPLQESDYAQNSSSFESTDDFERRILSNGNPISAIYRKLDKAEKAHDRSAMGSMLNQGKRSSSMDGVDDSYDTLNDGMGLRLKRAATYFEYDPDEVSKDDYSFRPDVNFASGMTYDTKDLDLGKPGVRRPVKRSEFQTTTEEVLRKADFRNVRFLANFITEAGIIIKRSKTGISAKAQRKVAREIKTARAFGLMPFTTMGTKHFVYGKTMEDQDEDFEYEAFDRIFVDDE